MADTLAHLVSGPWDAAQAGAWLAATRHGDAAAAAFGAGLAAQLRVWFREGRSPRADAHDLTHGGPGASDDATSLGVLYAAVLRRRAGVSLTAELFFCIELLFVESGHGATAPDGMSRYARVFVLPTDCARVATAALPALGDVLRAAGRSMLRAVAENPRVATASAECAAAVRAWLAVCPADDDAQPARGSGHQGVAPAADTGDNRAAHGTREQQAVFNRRQRARDAFYALLRDWSAAAGSRGAAAFAGTVGERARAIIDDMGVSNLPWFASLVVAALADAARVSQQLTRGSGAGDVPGLPNVDRGRLEKLGTRMGGGPSGPLTGVGGVRREPCDAAGHAIGHGDIFTRLLLVADSHALARHVCASALSRLRTLCGRAGEQAERAAAGEVAETLLAVRALGRVVGLLACYAPPHAPFVAADQVLAEYAATLNNLPPPIDATAALRSGVRDRTLAPTTVWLAEFALTAARDVLFTRTAAHTSVIAALCAAYRGIALHGTPGGQLSRGRVLVLATLETLFDTLSVSPWAAVGGYAFDNLATELAAVPDDAMLCGSPDDAISTGAVLASARLLADARARAEVGCKRAADGQPQRTRHSISRKVPLTAVTGPGSDTVAELLSRWFLCGNRDTESAVDFVADRLARRAVQWVAATHADEMAAARRGPPAGTSAIAVLSERLRVACDAADGDSEAAVRALIGHGGPQVAGVAAALVRERMRNLATSLLRARLSDGSESAVAAAPDTATRRGARGSDAPGLAYVADVLEGVLSLGDRCLAAQLREAASAFAAAIAVRDGRTSDSTRACHCAWRAFVVAAARGGSEEWDSAVAALLAGVTAASSKGLCDPMSATAIESAMAPVAETAAACAIAEALVQLAACGAASARDIERAVLATSRAGGERHRKLAVEVGAALETAGIAVPQLVQLGRALR